MNITELNECYKLHRTLERSGTNIAIYNAKNSMVQGVTIYGRSAVVDGTIKSVGDNGLTVTTANSDNTLTTYAEFTTALPLRGVSDTVRDKLTCTGDVKQVEKVCGEVKLSDLTWSLSPRGYFVSTVIDDANVISAGNIPPLLIPNYTPETFYNIYAHTQQYDKVCAITNGDFSSPLKSLYIIDKQYTTVNDFIQAINALSAVYELTTPVTTPLTTAEISQAENLQTFNPQTNVQNSSNAEMTITYNRRSPN